MSANDNTYHITCFICELCDKNLAEESYIYSENKIYCEKDYYERILGGCFSCNKLLEREFIEPEDGKKFHLGCFGCNECKKPLKDKYYAQDSKFYCKFCFEKLNFPTCAACDQLIIPTENDRELISSDDRKYHSKCFACSICKTPFESLQAYYLQNKFYCQDHYMTVLPKPA